MMIKSDKVDYLPLLTAVLLFLSFNPYFLWNSFYSYISPIVSCFIGLVFYHKRVQCFDTDTQQYLLLFFVLIIALYLFTGGLNVFAVILTFSVLFIPFASYDFMKITIRYLCLIYTIIIALAMISWGLMFLGIFHPINTIAPLNKIDFEYYTVYPLFMVISNSSGLYGAMRFCGPFDEPGVVGSISAILLCIEGFNFRNWKTYILLLSGILSFSMFFYLATFLYGTFYLLFVKKKIKYFILFIAAFVALYYFTKDDALISYTIWDRFEFDKTTNNFSGDDRMTYEAEEFYKVKRGTTEYWFGLKDYDSYWKLARGGCSYKNVVMKNGMLFMIMYAVFFLVIAWKSRKSVSTFLLFVFIYLGMLYQRPYIFQHVWIFLFIFLARMEAENKKFNYSQQCIA